MIKKGLTMMFNKSTHALAATIFTTSVLVGCSTTQLPLNAQRPMSPQHVRALSSGSTVNGQIAVKFKNGSARTQALSSSFRKMGIKRIKSVGTSRNNMEVLKVAPGQSLSKTIQKLNSNPNVLYAEPIFTIPFPKTNSVKSLRALNATPAAFPNDPMFSRQYAHKVSNSQQGWNMNKGKGDIIVGIVDSGVDVTHADLKTKIVGTRNSADNTDEVKDHVGHGTHVAGIAAAATNNGVGVAGVAANCKILAVKVASGKSMYPDTAGIANGVIWATDNGAKVINLSLGSSRQSRIITDAVKYAISKDVLVVAASGNGGSSAKSYPAATQGVMAVGATDSKDKRARFSQYGPHLSVTAPGVDILSTFPLNKNAIGPKEYGSISGTSMATPFVAGLAGLVRSQNPSLNAKEVRRIIEQSSDDMGEAGFDNYYGHGRVNVGNALRKASPGQ